MVAGASTPAKDAAKGCLLSAARFQVLQQRTLKSTDSPAHSSAGICIAQKETGYSGPFEYMTGSPLCGEYRHGQPEASYRAGVGVARAEAADHAAGGSDQDHLPPARSPAERKDDRTPSRSLARRRVMTGMARPSAWRRTSATRTGRAAGL